MAYVFTICETARACLHTIHILVMCADRAACESAVCCCWQCAAAAVATAVAFRVYAPQLNVTREFEIVSLCTHPQQP